MPRKSTVIRMEGKTFGNLLVLQRAGRAGKYATWLCRCSCGEEVVAHGQRLRRGTKQSCGKGGHRFTRFRHPSLIQQHRSEYQSWENMKERCHNPKHEKYPNYGGRGIKVCQRWDRSFEKFFEDMGPKPKDQRYTIERRDVNGDYEPGNCRWATVAEQSRNRRNSVFVTYQGRKMLLLDLVAELGLSRQIVYQRLKLGWSLEVALALPVKKYAKKPLANPFTMV